MDAGCWLESVRVRSDWGHDAFYYRQLCSSCLVVHFMAFRQNKQVKNEKSAVDVERFQPLNGSIDSHSVNLSATNDDVNLQWHQQQRQQLVVLQPATADRIWQLILTNVCRPNYWSKVHNVVWLSDCALCIMFLVCYEYNSKHGL